jgi:hypothetical protein
MTIRINVRAYDHARKLIADGRYVYDDRDLWSEHRPSTQRENEYIAEHGLSEYGRWYLGIDHERPENSKSRYSFPYGDFQRVHRCGVLAAEVRAGQYKHQDIETAAAHLHGQLDALGKSSMEA